MKVLWITPLRALSSDTYEALIKPISDLNILWKVDIRTGDTSSTIKRKQIKDIPDVLITTPESLSLLLSYKESATYFNHLRLIVADEWHELMGNKRGVMAELCFARLKGYSPQLRIWGLSATLGNIDIALKSLLGTSSSNGILVEGNISKKLSIKTIIPHVVERFPWAGHLGTTLLNDVLNEIETAKTTLVFTNTRSQTEIWFQALLNAKPDLAGLIALHHGSIDKNERIVVENMLREGKLKCVVCTSSLDLGVDFSPVDKVLQIGSPKGVARFLQRAGRSGHQPGSISEIICVPTNSFELIEFAAVRSAIDKKIIEPRITLSESLDVLSQHLVTLASGTGFYYDEVFRQIKSTYAFKDISKKEFDWVLDFITSGGPALRAYPEYKKVCRKDDFFCVENRSIARRHRMSIGTITAESSMTIKYVNGNYLGSIEESFISKLKAGNVFIFGGKALEYIRIKDMVVYVKNAKSNKGPIPQWMGGRMPLSSELAEEVRIKFEEGKDEIYKSEEMKAIKPLLDLQEKWSTIPRHDELLLEITKSREGFHLFVYPFEGKFVNEGIASILAFRLSRNDPATFSISTNDYGFELLSHKEIDPQRIIDENLFSSDHLFEDILHSLNFTEMSRRQFREIARIAGLVFQGYPGANKAVKQIQASSSLFYEVFRKYDPDNLLYKQSEKEILKKQLEEERLIKALDRMSSHRIIIKGIKHFTPMCFPIMAGRFREKLSTEKLSDRVKRMVLNLEKIAT